MAQHMRIRYLSLMYKMPPLIAYNDISSRVRRLIFGLSISLLPYFVENQKLKALARLPLYADLDHG